MSVKWQHVLEHRGFLHTEGLYDAAKRHWIIRSGTIGGFIRVGKEDAKRLEQQWELAERMLRALDSAIDAIVCLQAGDMDAALEPIKLVHSILDSIEGIDVPKKAAERVLLAQDGAQALPATETSET